MFVNLEDLAICAYSLCEDDFTLVKEYMDCIPESLYTLHNIAEIVGVKIRFSTVSILKDHVKPIASLKEYDIEQILENLKYIVNRENIRQASKTILKILMGREIEFDKNEQDVIEITIAAVYAALINTLNNVTQIYDPQINQTVELPLAPVTTIT